MDLLRRLLQGLRRLLRRLAATDSTVRLLIVPVLVFVALMLDTAPLADFWHHLARGRAIVMQGQLVDGDLFTFTVPGQAFQDVNWLTQVLYYLLHEQGGLELVRFVNALTLALTLCILVGLCRRVSGSLKAASAVGVFTFFGLWQVLTIRPQTCSLLLFVLMLDVLERARRQPRRQPRWLLVPPLLMALWANLHGAFPAGLLLIGCALLAAGWQAWKRLQIADLRFQIDRKSRPCNLQSAICNLQFLWRLAACLIASMLATLLNPYGWKIYEYVGLTSNTAAARRIDEWVPPSLDLWIGKAWLASLLILVSWFSLIWKNRLVELASEGWILASG